MKNAALFIIITGVGLTTLFAFASHKQPATARTEEYAIVSVIQVGKKNYISTTVGSKSTSEKEFESEKNAKRNDMAPVVLELEKLNEQGFELVSGSNAAIGTAGLPFYTFTLKRKI